MRSLTLVLTALVIPAAYHSVKSSAGTLSGSTRLPYRFTQPANCICMLDSESGGTSGQGGLLIISRGTAILLLAVYVAYLYFQVSQPTIQIAENLSYTWLSFQLVSHGELFTPDKKPKDTPEGERVPEPEPEPEQQAMSAVSAASAYVASPSLFRSVSLSFLSLQTLDCHRDNFLLRRLPQVSHMLPFPCIC